MPLGTSVGLGIYHMVAAIWW